MNCTIDEDVRAGPNKPTYISDPSAKYFGQCRGATGNKESKCNGAESYHHRFCVCKTGKNLPARYCIAFSNFRIRYSATRSKIFELHNKRAYNLEIKSDPATYIFPFVASRSQLLASAEPCMGVGVPPPSRIKLEKH